MRHCFLIVLVLALFGCAATPLIVQKEKAKPAVCSILTPDAEDKVGDTETANREIWTSFNNYYRDRDQRKLAVFFDGTANDKDDSTNVRRLYLLALEQACDGTPIIPYYDKGVGSRGGVVSRFLGLVVGQGASRNIRDAYQFLVETYTSADESKEDLHDQIFLFGFSRGAFQARSLNGFIEFAGLLKRESLGELDPFFAIRDMFLQYKTADDGTILFEKRLRSRIKAYTQAAYPRLTFYEEKKVKAIGVFDTVPALGFFSDSDPDNHRLDLYAEHGFHALALDERRNNFKLLRFNELKVRIKKGQELVEVWFPGVHADIGGGSSAKASGCRKTADGNYNGLEVIPLNWMMAKFEDFKLFPSDRRYQECVGGVLHDEFYNTSILWKPFGLFERKPAKGDRIHESVFERIKLPDILYAHCEREPSRKYIPSNLDVEVLDTAYRKEVTAGREGKREARCYSAKEDITEFTQDASCTVERETYTSISPGASVLNVTHRVIESE